jgi:succinate dehydrogenase / fumarate reductase cytochrome b subunit
MFKYNQGNPSPTMVHGGKELRDLYAVVLEAFRSAPVAWGYTVVMFLLGFHLRHGFWSAFQSLGALNPRLLPLFYALGLVVALLLAGGFVALPLVLHYVAAPGI